MRASSKRHGTASGRTAAIMLLLLVVGCTFGSPEQNGQPSPAPSSAEPLRYGPVGKDFCATARIHEVPVRFGLENELENPESRWSFQQGQTDTGVEVWRWWRAGCRYEAHAETGNLSHFLPRGTVIVQVFSHAGAARDHYAAELEKAIDGLSRDRAGPVTETPVDGRWDKGTRLEHIDDWFLGEYHLLHDNLYLSVPLATEILAREDADQIAARSRELLDALVAAAIPHVPLAG